MNPRTSNGKFTLGSGTQPTFNFHGNIHNFTIYTGYPLRMLPRTSKGQDLTTNSNHTTLSNTTQVGAYRTDLPASEVPFWISATYDPLPGGQWSTLFFPPSPDQNRVSDTGNLNDGQLPGTSTRDTKNGVQPAALASSRIVEQDRPKRTGVTTTTRGTRSKKRQQ